MLQTQGQRAGKSEKKQKGPFTLSFLQKQQQCETFSLSTTAFIKDQNSSCQHEQERNQQPRSKGQLTQNGDLAQEFFIHLPLPQSAALLLQEREKGGRTLHKVFL